MTSFDIITKTHQFEFSAKEFIDRYLLRGHYEIFLKDFFRKKYSNLIISSQPVSEKRKYRQKTPHCDQKIFLVK